MEDIKNKHVMLLWSKITDENYFTLFIGKLRGNVGDGVVLVENVDRLNLGTRYAFLFSTCLRIRRHCLKLFPVSVNLARSSVDVILAGYASQTSFTEFPSDTLELVLRYLKPNGLLMLREPLIGSDGKLLRPVLTLCVGM